MIFPIFLFLALLLFDLYRKKPLPTYFSSFNPVLVILLLVIVAVVWTTPWDNYLVATGVWFYDPTLVTGITIGWVPIEEYTFFIVQTIFTGLFFLLFAKRISSTSNSTVFNWKTRLLIQLPFLFLWFLAFLIVIINVFGTQFYSYKPLDYLSLMIFWLLPPIILQLAFGIDIILKHWKLVFFCILIPSLYLSLTDMVAIFFGTWTISITNSTGILFMGILPIEEIIFFFLTNILVVFGMTLLLSLDSRIRLSYGLQFLNAKNP